MVSLPVADLGLPPSRGCGSSCGAGLEKVYPTTAVRWGAMGWIGEFNYRPGTVFKCGAQVVIETSRGIELGQQVSVSCKGCNKAVSREQIRSYVEASGPEFYQLGSGKVLREATPQDVAEHTRLNLTAREDVDHCALLAAQMQLDMKVITCEHLLGGERIIFYFRADDRVDFRELVRELAQHHRTRIEMRQVGDRDEARLVADYEVCGRECCCKNFLKKTRTVTMKMAKLQKSTLDPAKLSGRCGRLRCCLRYEHEGYEELNRKLPRQGARVETELGGGFVIDRQVLTQLLLVRLEDGRQITVPVEELLTEPVARPQGAPPAAPAVRSAPAPDQQSGAGARPADGRPDEQPRDRSRRRDRRGRREGTGEGRAAPRDGQPRDVSPPPPAGQGAGGPQPPAQSDPPAQGDGQMGGRRSSRRRRSRRRRGPGAGPSQPPPAEG